MMQQHYIIHVIDPEQNAQSDMNALYGCMPLSQSVASAQCRVTSSKEAFNVSSFPGPIMQS